MTTAVQSIMKFLSNPREFRAFGIPGEENIRFVQALAKSKMRYIVGRTNRGGVHGGDLCGWPLSAGGPFAVGRPRCAGKT